MTDIYDKESAWDLASILKDCKEAKINYFNPFSGIKPPQILTVSFTDKYIFVLLRNGDLLQISVDVCRVIKKNTILPYMTPTLVKLNTKIYDIACGTEHIIARGRDCCLYGWGSNEYGQLGLKNVHYKEIPTRIDNIKGKVMQIFAAGYNSYYIDDQNKLYGFGSVSLYI